ncbi:hypothetical protein Sru01_45980 [Sphaerisporangium rufum]|uniref:DUF397 domain-containing protein n=1 Tax=Sphaerisporangium rufum TaxID=1381558 RepID=A0A919V010_9ACTN|nr:DUF397 domain-containing protein [Sphaerisporangium rufum]GII79616.1 hypothetical protein Sru01_45980 [Sphaerisporangium rufum]
MSATDLVTTTWRKSTHSGANDNCVEVGGSSVAPERGVRDSKDSGGPMLCVPAGSARPSRCR